MEEINYGHKPVLLHECLDALAIRPDGVYLDGTLGRAGHSLEIVRRLTAGGRLIALDRDETAIEAAQRRLADYMDRVTLVHSNFSALDDVLRELGVRGVDGMLFDLGVSSPQLDDAARGFSYKQDAPLDMRMDESASYTARELVNTVSYEELKRILYEYGEERYAPAIAKKICAYRTEKPIETTLELADLIRSAMPAAALREKQHPAKRSFQAIRIAVNDELGELPPMLRAAEKNLKPGGRLAVITFHSLEDRIVKSEMQQAARGCTCPPEFPVCICGKKPLVKLVTRKPIVSGPAELEENPRARSAKPSDQEGRCHDDKRAERDEKRVFVQREQVQRPQRGGVVFKIQRAWQRERIVQDLAVLLHGDKDQPDDRDHDHDRQEHHQDVAHAQLFS